MTGPLTDDRGLPPRRRVRAIDWTRGLVMVLMTIDHAGAQYDAQHLHGDTATGWVSGTPLPPAEFLTRWITHLCAPVFVLLAGTSLALASEKRRDEPGQTAFLVKRGLLIAALDPLWMGLGFSSYRFFPLQVLYAIGTSMVLLAFLRKLSSAWLLGIALTLATLSELAMRVHLEDQPWLDLWRLLLVKGRITARLVCPYPTLPWLSIMIFGFLLGRWMLRDPARTPPSRTPELLGLSAALLAAFGVVRGVDGYGNGELYRDSLAPLQWLHVAKYPPSLAFMTLELGIGFFLLAVLFQLDDDEAHPLLAPLGLLGKTAFFYYLLHVHLLALAGYVLHVDMETNGLAKTYGGAILVLLVLYPACVRWSRYKVAHPDGWTRYL